VIGSADIYGLFAASPRSRIYVYFLAGLEYILQLK